MALQPISRDEVLQLVKMRGPLIPNDLRQQLKLGDTILLGAMLSELASKSLVKISSVKIGGSPFYYDPANPAALEKVAGHLNEKDKRTYDLLKEKKVLRDDEHEALIRVSLRNIKDYALPLTVGGALYWRYYLVPESEAQLLIKRGAAPPLPTPPATEKQAVLAEKEAAPAVPSATPPQPRATKRRKEPAQPGEPKPSDSFAKAAHAFFQENNIKVLDQRLIKKGEIDFIIELPTPVGSVTYFCKAKAKKSTSDGDLASAKLQGAAKNLPTIYLTNGELSKRAKEMLEKELKGLVVKRV
jgi:hypothetical protein